MRRFSWIQLSILFAIMQSFVPGKTARAGAIPTSAYAGSLLYPVSFLDQPTLVYQFPEQAIRFPTQLLGMVTVVNQSASEVGVGALVHRGGNGFFLLGQPWTRFEMQGGIGSATLMQGGWATGSDRFRAGVALRGTNAETHVSESSGSQSSRRAFEANTVEAAIGIGTGDAARGLDLSLEAISDYYKSEYSRLYRITLDDKPYVGLAWRGRLPIGSRTGLVTTGHWNAQHERWANKDVTLDPTPEDYRDDWFTGASIEGTTASVDWLAVWGSYAATRVSSGPRDDSGRTNRSRTRTTQLGLSVRDGLNERFVGHAGVRGQYESQMAGEISMPRGYQSSRTTNKFSERLAWGLAYTRKNIALTGSIDTALNLDQMLLLLDVRILL